MANANFTCVLEAWRSGKTLYGRMHYYRSDGQTFTYQDSSFPNPTMNLAGTTYTDTDFGNRVRAGIQVGNVYSTTFSRTVAGTGDRTVTWTAGSGTRSDFAGSWSQTVNFPVEYTPPTGLNVTIKEIYTDGAKFGVSISSYGNPDSVSGRWIEAGIAGQNAWQSPALRSAVALNTTSADIIVNNSSVQTTTLNILPNTQYYYGGYSTNTQQRTSAIFGQLVTLALAPTLSVSSVSDTSAVLNYSLPADGGYYAKNVQYSLNGGSTWITGATINTGNAATGSFTISGLNEDTNYTVITRVTTISGSTSGNTVTFKTEIFGKMYGSVSSKTKRIKKMYGSVNGKTKKILKMYGSVNGKTKRVF